ncbi:MAG: peptidase M61 [Cytophagales bacterium]|nr:peptidase M61 [Cytophagales bacterium]MDW8383784.1 peptidase M61 [Flammeovirgaceae bacterium]
MKQISLLAFLLMTFTVVAQQYFFRLDLRKVQNDKLTVNCLVPSINSDEILYHIPKVVPGTYSISDFGRFITDFTAFDKNGNLLETQKISTNSWKIQNAQNLYEISYKVDDTWDANPKDNFIFEPAGTNIQVDTNYVINPFGFFGYFEGMKSIPYQVTIFKRPNFYGSTSLIPIHTTDTSDTYQTESYMELADAPMMYCIPDTTFLDVGGASILVSIYSPNHVLSSKFMASQIASVLEAQRKYLGGKLPIQKYAFIIYLTSSLGGSGLMGALEHSHSSFYYLPEVSGEHLTQTIRDIASHEFFHILTPLSIHSEEIHDFDYINPKMSKHLWLYEGCTEYFASHVQVRYGLMELDDYLENIRRKIETSRTRYNDTLPFTEMSANCLETYQQEYGNVYEKGALIALCLDITLRKLSDGKYGLMDMMLDLSKYYGKTKPFKDHELFDKIVEITQQPALKNFFEKYVAGKERLPLQEVLNWVGIEYIQERKIKDISLGNIGLGINENEDIIISDVSEMDDFGKKMGYRKGDIIHSINGRNVTLQNAMEIFKKLISQSKDGDKLVIEVIRKNKKGKDYIVTLKGKLKARERIQKNVLLPIENMSSTQNKLLRAWLLGNEQ